MKKKSFGEDISCLVDGELGKLRSRATLERVESDPESREHWESYCIIGDAMRRVSVLPAEQRFADQIAARLQSEPTVLAPAPWRRTAARGAYWGGGLAVAASVMVVAVMVYQNNDLVTGSDVATEVAATNRAATVPQENLSLDRDPGIQTIRRVPDPETGETAIRYAGMQAGSGEQVRTARPVYYWETQPRTRAKYNSYLVRHNQYASRQGGAGFVNYARVVSADHEPVPKEQSTEVQ